MKQGREIPRTDCNTPRGDCNQCFVGKYNRVLVLRPCCRYIEFDEDAYEPKFDKLFYYLANKMYYKLYTVAAKKMETPPKFQVIHYLLS